MRNSKLLDNLLKIWINVLEKKSVQTKEIIMLKITVIHFILNLKIFGFCLGRNELFNNFLILRFLWFNEIRTDSSIEIFQNSDKASKKKNVVLDQYLRAWTPAKWVIPFAISIKVAHILNDSNTGDLDAHI